jgi:hypothetical protein
MTEDHDELATDMMLAGLFTTGRCAMPGYGTPHTVRRTSEAGHPPTGGQAPPDVPTRPEENEPVTWRVLDEVRLIEISVNRD